jgi:DnaJ-class molecular chaperone
MQSSKIQKKRQKYAQFGEEALKWRLIFYFFFGKKQNRKQKIHNIIHEAKDTLEYLYNGVEVSLTIEKNLICYECKGSGCSEGKNAQTCSKCKGQGRQANVVHL